MRKKQGDLVDPQLSLYIIQVLNPERALFVHQVACSRSDLVVELCEQILELLRWRTLSCALAALTRRYRVALLR